MAQLLLPIFPSDTQMITLSLGVREHNDTIYYFHVGVPIFSHAKGDLKKFRYITTLLHELQRRKGRYGLETMCIGGGQGIAAVFERM